MTIRDHLNRHRFISTSLYVGGMALGGLSAWLFIEGHTDPSYFAIAAFYLGFVSMMTGMVYFAVGGRCPRCRRRLPYYGMALWRVPRALHFCPFCATPIDSPFEIRSP